MKKRIWSYLLITISFIFCTVPLLYANSSIPSYANLVKRKVLVFYDSNEGSKNAHFNTIEQTLEASLNHLGLVLSYHNVNDKDFPSHAQMKDYIGTIAFFYDNKMKSPLDYIEWVKTELLQNRKFVILNNFGAYYDLNRNKTSLDKINEVLSLLFLEDHEYASDNVFAVEVVKKDSQMVEFERTLDYELQYYRQYKSLSSKNSVYLVCRRNDFENSESAMVGISSTGGWAFIPLLFEIKGTSRRAFYLNPFLFFSKAFQLERNVKPDRTTLYGRRIFFSHIDGDGFTGISEIDHKTLCSEVILEHIIKKFPLPITTSIITADFIHASIPEQKKQYDTICKKVFSQKNVEIGSHTYSHPLDWDKQIVASKISGYSQSINFSKEDQEIASESAYGSFNITEVNPDEFVKKETIDSTKYIDEYLAGKKKTKVLQWSGNCYPPNKSFELLQKQGVLNINGGGGRCDAKSNSYACLFPIGKFKKYGWQIYTPNYNENVYTNLWEGPYYGFYYVIDTFKQTESPIRILPINVYYHFYSGAKRASLYALEKIYSYCLQQKIHPLFTSDYVNLANDWLSLSLYKNQETWFWKNEGYVRTFRIDDTKLYPDLEKSHGVIGYQHYQGSLYVFIDDTKEGSMQFTEVQPKIPYIKESMGGINKWSSSEKEINFRVSGYGEIIIVLANMEKKQTYKILIGKTLLNEKTNAKGELSFVVMQNDVFVNENLPIHIVKG